jgi:hypothetical protein
VCAEKCIGLLDRIARLYGLLDLRPEFILDPVARHQDLHASQSQLAPLHLRNGVARLQRTYGVEPQVWNQPCLRNHDLGALAGLVGHAKTIDANRRTRRYASLVRILLTVHVFGAIFLLGGVSAHALLRPMANAADVAGRKALFDFAWRVQLALVYTGSVLVFLTGLLLWIGRFKLFTGWLLLGVLLFIAAMGLQGAFLAPNLRRLRAAATEPGGTQSADAAATTIQVVAWFLLAVVVFLMVDRPF